MFVLKVYCLFGSRCKSHWYIQLFFLYRRCYQNYFRNTRVVIIDLLMTIITAVLGGTIYFKTPQDFNNACTFTEKSSANISTALFYSVTAMTVLSVLSAITVILKKIKIDFFVYIFKKFSPGLSTRNTNFLS